MDKIDKQDFLNQIKKEKVPVHAEDIERALLGNVMVDQSVQDLIIPQMREEYFYVPICYSIAKSIIEMYKSGKKIDLLTVRHNCKVDNVELMKIQGEGASAINVQENLAILKQFYLQRYAKNVSVVLENISENEQSTIDDMVKVIDEAASEIDNVLRGATKVYDLDDNLDESISGAEHRRELFKKGETPGIKTGFEALDRTLLGWQKSDLVIIAARPGMGKTSMCLHHAKGAAKKGNHVRIYSLEMSRIKLVDRLLLSECGFKHYKFMSGDLTEENLNELRAAKKKLTGLNIWIDDKPARSIESIHSDSKYWKKEDKCDMIIIDYLQLSEVSDEHARLTLNERTSRISRRAKAIAKDLDIPVLLISQLNRDIERRSGIHIPLLSDLRDSGAIEQDADIVLFVYRPAIYGDGECEIVKNNYKIDSCDSVGFYLISKNRNGPTGYILFKHNESLTSMKDYEISINKKEEPPF